MHAKPLTTCPQCGKRVRRVISGGMGIIIKGGGGCSTGTCSLQNRGITCCGSDTPCGTPGCRL
jgi:predicted nucleic acid-binding Zn ribbon protein